MIDSLDDPFEAAAAAAALEIEPEVPPETSTAEMFAESAPEVRPPRRPRGRPRGRGRSHSRRRSAPRAAVESSGESAQSARALEPTEVQSQVVLPALPPEKLVPLLRQIDKAFVRLLGTQPLDDQELKDGSEACAPVLDHYVPLFLSQPWASAVIWAGMVYAPRMVEVYDRRKAKRFPASTDSVAQDAATHTVGR